MTFPKFGHGPVTRVGIPSIRISVVPRMVRITRRIQWGLASLAICAGLFTGWMWWEIHAREEDRARYSAAAERTEVFNGQLMAQLEQERPTLSAQKIAALQEELRFVNQLAEKRAFSWTQLLHDLEEALPAGTSIGKIQRDVKHATITIEGRATGMTALNTLMSTLQSRSPFRHPVLHHHHFIDADHSNGGGGREVAGVEFSVTVEYRGRSEKAPTDDIS